MTLVEEMRKQRIEKTTLTEEELQKLFDDVKNFFLEWQQKEIDKNNFLVNVNWTNNSLTLYIGGGEDSKKIITEEICSKVKQKSMLQKLEEKLKQEGVEITQNCGHSVWNVDML